MNKPFLYNVNLIPLKINNEEQSVFRDKLNAIPYLLYEVESLKNGDKIVINKPGGKRNFGRLARNDFMVFIYNHSEKTLWLISHDEIKNDLTIKYENNSENAIEIIKGLFAVCKGEEPDIVLSKLKLKETIGLPVENIYKVYKWIWGQEDCNYPTGQGRWLSMNSILEFFKIKGLE